MNGYIGDIRLGDTIDVKFTTVNTSGVPTTLAGSPVISAYPGNSTTEVTAGITLTVDFDSRTGMHNVRVVASNGNGYAAGNYYLVITTGTVSGSSVVGYVIGSFSIESRSAVMPTTAARTLDVSAGGEAGVDWANVGSPTTTLGLSGTTVKTATDVETDTQDIQARLPAALVSGRIDSSVGAYQTGLTPLQPTTAGRTLDVSTTGEAGVDWANVGSPSTSVNLAATTTNVVNTATAVTTVNGLAANVITATSIATGAFTATKFASGAFDAVWTVTVRTLSAFAFSVDLSAGAVQAIWDALTSALTTVGSIGKLLVDRIDAAITSRLAPTVAARTLDVTATGAAGIDWANVENPTTTINFSGTTIKTATDVEADTQDIQSRLPAALVSGRIDASVGAYQTGLVPLQPTTAGRTLDVTATGEAGIDWSNIGAPTTVVDLSGTTIKTATDIATQIAALNNLSPTQVEDAVWDATLADHLDPGSTGEALDTASASGSDPWATALPGAYASGTAGKILSEVNDQTSQLAFTTPNQVDARVLTNSDKTGYTTTTADKKSAADEFLDRDLAGAGSGSSRNVRNALRPLRNKVATTEVTPTTGTVDVYEEDDSSIAWSADLTKSPGDPITSVDPTQRRANQILDH